MLYGEINRQRLKIINEHVVADTIDYLEARFAFSKDWDGLEKWVHFAKDGEVYDIRLTDDCVRKEDHLNLSAGIWKVYLHGNEFSGGKVIERITTNAAILKVEPTGTLDGEPFPEMPASVTEQILARLEDIEQNGGGSGGGISRETDPTVPDWAKQPEKPTYTAEEVGAASAEQFNQLSEAIADLEDKIPADVSGMTAAQISALDGMFKIAAYTADATEAYAAFKAAFGIGDNEGGEDDDGDSEPVIIPATGIELSTDTLAFDSVTSQLLIATVTPDNSTDEVVWASSNQNVATVSGGVVKSVADGSCVITATAGTVSASCNVTVALPDVDGYEQGYLNDSGVLTNSATDFVSTAYRDVTPGDSIILMPNVADNSVIKTFRINEYDENKNFIKRQYTGSNNGAVYYGEFTLGDTTKFVRVGFGTNDTDTEFLDSLFANYSLLSSSEVGQRAIDLTAEIGGLSNSDGGEIDGNDRLRTDFVEGNNFKVYSCPVKLSTSAARKYDSNKVFTTVAADAKYIRILLVAAATDTPNDIFGTIIFVNGNFYRIVEG